MSHESSYPVTITREPAAPDDPGPTGEHWVARDSNGCWRNYCPADIAETALDALVKMFHADEIEPGSVGSTARILSFAIRQPLPDPMLDIVECAICGTEIADVEAAIDADWLAPDTVCEMAHDDPICPNCCVQYLTTDHASGELIRRI